MNRIKKATAIIISAIMVFSFATSPVAVCAETTPPTPKNLKLTSCTESSVTVAWDAVDNWNIYQVICSDKKLSSPYFGDEWINYNDPKNIKETFNGLKLGKTYYVYLRAAHVNEDTIIEDGHPTTIFTITGSKILSIKVTPRKKNPLAIKGKTANVKYSETRNKSVSLTVSKAMKISKAKGSLTYKKKSGNKNITINKKTGKITVKKGINRSFYTVTVAVKAAGNKTHSSVTKSVTFYVNVN